MIITATAAGRKPVRVEVRRRSGVTAFNVVDVAALTTGLIKAKVPEDQRPGIILLVAALAQRNPPAFFTYRIDKGAPR